MSVNHTELAVQERTEQLERLLTRWAKLIGRTKTWSDKNPNNKPIVVQFSVEKKVRMHRSGRIVMTYDQTTRHLSCQSIDVAKLHLTSDGRLARYLPKDPKSKLPFGEYVLVSSLTAKEQSALYSLIPAELLR